MVTPSRPAGYYGGASEIHAPLGPNPYAWSKISRMLFIEQPVGVGFSSSTTTNNSSSHPEPQTEDEVARDFVGFLRNFYNVFPETQPRRLILTGES